MSQLTDTFSPALPHHMTPPTLPSAAPAAAALDAPPNPHVPARRPHLSIRPTRGWAALQLREIWQFRELLLRLAGRDLKLRYKQTALGVIWVVLQPLMAAGVLFFVFNKVAKLPSTFLSVYAGLMAWGLFSNTLTKTSACLVGNAQLISKVFFPRLILPLSTVPSALVDFAVAAAMLAVMMAINGIAPTPAVLLLLVPIAILLALALGVGLLTASLAVSYRDVQYVLPVFLQILLYASPVAYTVSMVPPDLRPFYTINPLSGVLECFRWCVLGLDAPPLRPLLYSAAVAATFLLIGLYAFKRMERKFADVI
jgi:lipopolysaccharide transport system permease protein